MITGVKPESRKAPAIKSAIVGLEAAHQQRRRDRPHHRAELRAGGGRQADRLHVGGPAANGASRA